MTVKKTAGFNADHLRWSALERLFVLARLLLESAVLEIVICVVVKF